MMCRASRRGFTLVEVMIVVVFLAIVATLMIPLLDKPTMEARRTAVLQQLQSITNQIEVYRSTHAGAFPTSHPTDPMGEGGAKSGWGILVSESYLKEEPLNLYTLSTRLGAGGVEVAAEEPSTSEHGWYYEVVNDVLAVYASGYDPAVERFSNEEEE